MPPSLRVITTVASLGILPLPVARENWSAPGRRSLDAAGQDLYPSMLTLLTMARSVMLMSRFFTASCCRPANRSDRGSVDQRINQTGH